MSDESTVRTVTQMTTGELFVNVTDLTKFLADAAERCNSKAGKDAIISINTALLSMTKSKA